MAHPPEPPTSRRRRPPLGRRRAGEAAAGQVLGVMAAGLVLAALVNADALVERAEGKPFAWLGDQPQGHAQAQPSR